MHVIMNITVVALLFVFFRFKYESLSRAVKGGSY